MSDENDGSVELLGKYDLVPCSEEFTGINQQVPDLIQNEVIPNSLCIPGEKANMNGSKIAGVDAFTRLQFEHCMARTDKSRSKCWGAKETEDWIKENSPKYSLVVSFDFLDFEEQDEPFRKGVTVIKMSNFDTPGTRTVDVPFLMNSMELADDIWNPFIYEPDQDFYLTTDVDLTESLEMIMTRDLFM